MTVLPLAASDGGRASASNATTPPSAAIPSRLPREAHSVVAFPPLHVTADDGTVTALHDNIDVLDQYAVGAAAPRAPSARSIA